MPAKIKVRIVAARDLPVMDRSSDLADAFAEVRNLLTLRFMLIVLLLLIFYAAFTTCLTMAGPTRMLLLLWSPFTYEVYFFVA